MLYPIVYDLSIIRKNSTSRGLFILLSGKISMDTWHSGLDPDGLATN